ncbi:MAG: hypothetical protein ACKVS6_05220 [Planctomycetota bacterium]
MAQYRIRGLDGREYGPVDQEKLVQWAREARIVGTMMVQKDDSGVWVTASSLPELAGAFSTSGAGASGNVNSGSANTGGANYGPGSFTAEKNPNAPLVKNPNADLSVGNCYGRAWGLLDFTFVLQVFVALLVMSVFPILLAGPIWVGVYRCAIKKIDGETYEFSEMFSGFNQFADALIGYILYFLATVVSLCCPPLYVFVVIKLWLWDSILADHPGRKGMDALQDSWNLTTNHFGDLFMLALTAIGVYILGILACFIGVFVALPVIVLATAVTYRELVPKQKAAPATV